MTNELMIEGIQYLFPARYEVEVGGAVVYLYLCICICAVPLLQHCGGAVFICI